MTPKQYIEEPVTNPPDQDGTFFTISSNGVKRVDNYYYKDENAWRPYPNVVSWLRPMTEEEMLEDTLVLLEFLGYSRKTALMILNGEPLSEFRELKNK